MEAVAADQPWTTHWVTDPAKEAGPTYPARDMFDQHGPGGLGLRRSGRAVRHDDQPLAHLPEFGPDQRLESLLGVHVPRRHGLQPGQHQPDEVPQRRTATFDVERFQAACRLVFIAQEILVDHASYPTQRIAANSHRFRPLGLGYSNLGSLIMASGIPYDSDEARGPVRGHDGPAARRRLPHQRRTGRRGGTLRRLRGEPRADAARHGDALGEGRPASRPPRSTSRRPPANSGTTCCVRGRRYGFRNAQATVLAPTGTISFMMDCDTTGIEPDIALVKYKQLAGGGMLKIVNQTVPLALRTLGYRPSADRRDRRLHRQAGHDRRGAPT